MPRPLPRHLLDAASHETASDGELLRRYVRDGDATAFELVVRRHAAAVWAVCRRILPEADAEDAFQAAFLVLVRKALAVRGASAGGWLHRVAVTAALKRKASARRVVASGGGEPADSSRPPTDPLEQAELASAVHEELARLPDRYRLPVVLCDLEGESQPAAAARLGWPVGSVAGRLCRARALLRDRLTRRGFAPTGSVLVLPVVAVPGRVVSAAVGGAEPSPAVGLLVTGVLGAMRTAKLKLVARGVAAVCLVASVGYGAYHAAAQPLPPPREAKEPAPKAPPVPKDGIRETDESFTAFPDITPPAVARNLSAEFPLLLGDDSVRFGPGDNPYRRLLLARLQQGRDYMKRMRIRMEIGSYRSEELLELVNTCDDIHAVVSELWAGEPARLDAWLVELVRYLKANERNVGVRVPNIDPPQALNVATRHRLKMEAALWKHRNPARQP